MPYINVDRLGQPLSENSIRRNRILHDVDMMFGSNASLERQVATLQDSNENMGRELIRSNLRYTETTIKIKKLNDELELHKSTIDRFEVQIGAFVKVDAKAEGQIKFLGQANRQLQGQLDHLHQLNRHLTQQNGQMTGLLNARMVQYKEAVDQVTVLKTKIQLFEDLVDSNPTVMAHLIDTKIHAVNDFVMNGPGATARPKIVGIHDQQPEVPTFAKDQVLTPLPNGSAVPSNTAHPNDRHGISTRAFTSSTEVKAQAATSSQITATKLPKIIMPGIVRGGKDVDDSFQRFLRNQNSHSVALNINRGASLTPNHNNVACRKLNPESVPFTPSASVAPPSGTLNPLSEPFVPAGRIQPSGLITSFPALNSEGKKPLHLSESLVRSGAKDEPTEFTTSHPTLKLNTPNVKLMNSPISSNAVSATAGIIKETVLPPYKRSATAVKVEPAPSINETCVTHDAASTAIPAVEPVTLVTTMGDSKLPPHKRVLCSVAGNKVGETSDKCQAHDTVDVSTANGVLNVPIVPVKGQTSISASGIDAATKKWLDGFDDQTTLACDSHRGLSVAAEAESLISLPSSPQAENAKLVPLPPGYTPIGAPDATTLPATSTKPTNISKAYTVPKYENTLASDFVEAAKKKMTSFTTKYASDPGAETRKELAEKGQALRSKLEAEESGGIKVLKYLGMEYGPHKIVGTHILGELLDKATKAHVLMHQSRGDVKQLDLEWKPVEKNGKVCFVL